MVGRIERLITLQSSSLFLAVLALMSVFFCLAGSLFLTSCAANRAATLAERDQQFRAQEYVVPLDNQPNAPVMTLRVAAVRIGNKDLLVPPDSWRAQEIRASITNFVAAISRELSRASSSASAGQPAQIAISFDGTQDAHAGSAFAKGFVTGLLTLGLVGYVAPGVYSYRSTVSVDVSGKDGKKGTYSAESQEVSAKYDLNDRSNKAAAKAGSTARRLADDESLEKVAKQMVEQGFFQ